MQNNKLGVITCIPKAGIPQKVLNWRSFSLLNVIYRIASGFFAETITLFRQTNT